MLVPRKKYMPTGISSRIYLFRDSNRNTRAMCEICLKLTIKSPERHQWHVLVSLLLTLNSVYFFQVFSLLTMTIKCRVGNIQLNLLEKVLINREIKKYLESNIRKCHLQFLSNRRKSTVLYIETYNIKLRLSPVPLLFNCVCLKGKQINPVY